MYIFDDLNSTSQSKIKYICHSLEINVNVTFVVLNNRLKYTEYIFLKRTFIS